jgi:hypothetical protein
VRRDPLRGFSGFFFGLSEVRIEQARLTRVADDRAFSDAGDDSEGKLEVTVRDVLNQVLDSLPEQRVREVLDFAMFLHWREEDQLWQQFGLEQLAKAYGPDEPEYTEADIRPELNQ